MSRFELVRLRFDEIEASSGFAQWLSERRLSIALTKGNSLWLIGVREDRSLSLTEHNFGTCMGLAAGGPDALLLATRYQIWHLENCLPRGALDDAGHDRVYLPQAAWTTGTLLVRDLAAGADGDVLFVSGLFSCLCRPSSRLNFEPVWVPPFVSALAAEDRCHLSGVALAGASGAFVTSASTSDEPGGWRRRRADGGVVVSVPDGTIVADGLSMPCSPVFHGGRLWLCLGGSGELAVIDLADGSLTRVGLVPGFARGLAIDGGYAVVGVSPPHRGDTFEGLPLAERLIARQAPDACGVDVLELESGRTLHSLRFAGGSGEINALVLLPGVASARAVGITSDDAQELVTITPSLPR